jgi:hypothetical protein
MPEESSPSEHEQWRTGSVVLTILYYCCAFPLSLLLLDLHARVADFMHWWVIYFLGVDSRRHSIRVPVLPWAGLHSVIYRSVLLHPPSPYQAQR